VTVSLSDPAHGDQIQTDEWGALRGDFGAMPQNDGGDRTGWLGREDSNLGIRIDGYSPDGAIALYLARYLNAPPARSPGGSESQRGLGTRP
jgi:hypothetical protein